MRKAFIGIFLLILLAVFLIARNFGVKSPIIVSGQVALSDELAEQASGFETLFIIIYDAESNMPMPYGAYKDKVKAINSGVVLDNFIITREKLQIMFPDLPLPKRLNVKVRLDRDGVAGRDQEGDLTGRVDNIALGTENIKLIIDNKIAG